MAQRKAKKITNKDDIDYLLNLDNDVTTSIMMECFGEFNEKKRFNPYDEIDIPVGKYGKGAKKNKNIIHTTVGIWIFNKFLIEEDLIDIFGYINKEIDDGEFSKINSRLSYALLEDDITTDQLHSFLMKTQKLMPFVSILSPSYTLKMLTCSKVIDKKKAELVKKYEKELAANDEKIISVMEKELLDYAKEYLKDDPSMDMYLSGARGTMGNNFKNMFVMRGAIKDPDPLKGYDIVTSNYMDGISNDDYIKMCKSLVEGPYARGKKTEVGGYQEKLYISAFQHIIADPAGSDCKTKRTVTVTLNDKNIKDWMYSYIVENEKLIELNSKNMDKYIGKTVKFRYSSMCESKTGICNKCLGNLYLKLGITNIGLASSGIQSKLKNMSMKLFHSNQVEFVEMDIGKAFGIK